MPSQNLIVGQTFPTIKHMQEGEDASLNYLEDGSLCILIRFGSLTSEVMKEIQNGEIQFRHLQNDDKILLLVRFGSLPPLQLPFNPSIYTENGLEFKIQSNLINIYVVEHTNSKLILKRTMTVYQDFLDYLCNFWYRNTKKDNLNKFSSHYYLWLIELSVFFGATNVLWELAIPINWKN